MNAEEFGGKLSALIEQVAKDQQAKTAMAVLNRPSAELTHLFGPMTDRVSKDLAVEKAIDLYNKYYGKDYDFDQACHRLASVVRSLPSEATTGAIEAMAAVHHLSTSFEKNMREVASKVKRKPSAVKAVLLQVLDTSITTALTFVPVAGPFIAPLSMGVGGLAAFGTNLGLTVALSHVPTIGPTLPGNINTTSPDASVQSGGARAAVDNITKAVAAPGGVLDKVSNAKGVASLTVALAEAALQAYWGSVQARMGSPSKGAYMKCCTPLTTQNQDYAQSVNKLCSNLAITIPDSLSVGRARWTSYVNNGGDTLSQIASGIQKIFIEFLSLVRIVISAGVADSFNSSIDKININQSKEYKIGILILGYFYSKDWAQSGLKHEFKKATSDAIVVRKILDQHDSGKKKMGDDLYHSFTEDYNKALGVKASPEFKTWEAARSGFSALGSKMKGQRNEGIYNTVAQELSGKLTRQEMPSLSRASEKDQLKIFETKAATYFGSLKKAITADLATTMCDGNGGYLKDEQMQKLLKLYIGSLLIVNETMTNVETEQKSSVRWLTQKLSKGAVSVEEGYVDMLYDAGYIHRYSGSIIGTVSKERKLGMIERHSGQLRWSRNPSDTERAMLLTFCTIVVTNVDIGKILMGFIAWKSVEDQLTGIVDLISRAGAT